MTASAILSALGITTALFICAIAVLYAPEDPSADIYQATIKLIAGIALIAGSLILASAISRTFLRYGGRAEFKALYWASLAMAGLGLTEAMSGFLQVNMILGMLVTAIPFIISGFMLIRLYAGGF